MRRLAQLGCGVAQLVVSRLTVRQGQISAGHPREDFPSELRSDEEMEKNLGGDDGRMYCLTVI